MNGQFITLLVSVFANFLLLVLIAIHLRKSLSGRYLFWSIIGLSGWIIANYYSNLEYSINALTWINKLIFFFTAIFGTGLAMFAKTFPEDQRMQSVWKSIIAILFIFVLAISLSPVLIKKIIPNDGIVDLEFGWGMLVYSIYMLGTLAYAAIRISTKYYFEKNSEIKNSMQLLLLGISIFLLLAIGTNLILPLLGIFYLTILAPVYTSVFGFIIFLAILKYHFLNVKIITTELFTFSLWIFLTIEIFITKGFYEFSAAIVMLVFSIIFGYLLIKSVREEVLRKEELEIANAQLRKLDEAKSEFISIASHQLRTPLTTSKGFLSLISEGNYGVIPEELKHPLDRISNANNRLLHLVEDLLNISRIESGRMVFEFKNEKIENILKEIVDSFELSAKEKDLKLSLELPKKSLPLVSIDRGKIFEAVSNLVDNSLKYTKAGSVIVSAKLQAKAVRITVSDTGIGIPKEDLGNIFGKFSRGSNQKRLTSTGTGLGLYFGKKVVEANHGKMWVESDGEGKGSRFIIEIPVEHVD